MQSLLADVVRKESQQPPQRRPCWERCPWRKPATTTNVEHAGRCCPRREPTATTTQNLLDKSAWAGQVLWIWILSPPASGKMLEHLILAWLFCSQRFDDSIEREHDCCNKQIKLQLFGMVRLTLKVNGQLFGMVGLTLNVDDQLFGMVRLTSAIPPKLTANLFLSLFVTFAKTCIFNLFGHSTFFPTFQLWMREGGKIMVLQRLQSS